MLTATASQIADVTTTPQQQPGLRVKVPNQGTDHVLYYVNASSGNVTIKDGQRKPAGTDVAVTHPESSGDQEWVYVYNSTGSPIARGDLVAFDTDGTNPLAEYHVREAPANCPVGLIVGAAQHTIPAGSYGYVLAKGVGKVYAVGAVATSVNIVPSATAGQVAAGAATVANVGFTLLATGGAGLTDARLNCPG